MKLPDGLAYLFLGDYGPLEVSRLIISARLENSFIQATNDKARVEAQAKQCKERLDLANRLIFGLGSEKDRWGKEIEQLKKLLLKKDLDQIVDESYIEVAARKLGYKNVLELKKDTLLSYS